MFGKLKEKLKSALSIFSKKAEEEAVEKAEERIIKQKEVEQKAKEPIVDHKLVADQKIELKEAKQKEEKKDNKKQKTLSNDKKEELKEEKKEKKIKTSELSKLHLSREEAINLLKKYNSDLSDFNHYLESEAVMKALAKRLGEDEDYWAMLGLLHDVDWGITKQDVKTHLSKAPQILREAGFDDQFIQIIVSHGYGFDLPDLKEKQRTEKVEHALACAETVTGLVYAYALMRGKNISGMEAKGLKKKFKDKTFAANCNREVIKECENLGLELDEFLQLAIDALKEIASEIGLNGSEKEKIAATLKVYPKKEEKPKTEKPASEEITELGIEKKSFFEKLKQSITTKTISAEKFDSLFWELELALLENNVSVEVIERIKEDLKIELVDKPLPRDVEAKIEETLQNTLEEILSFEKIDLLKNIKHKKEENKKSNILAPYIIALFGINGTGKTTSIAKLANYFQKNNLSVVLAACDTFRAAAIQQLEEHANRLNVKMIKHDYGSDAAAVAFDAVKYAQKNNIDVVLIDTAGRLHSNTNLMAELEKVIRVTKPDFSIFVGESITGNDCIEQAQRFNELTKLDGVILTKADVDEKGGAPLSISYTIKKPILFLGTGQGYEDLEEFNKEKILRNLGF